MGDTREQRAIRRIREIVESSIQKTPEDAPVHLGAEAAVGWSLGVDAVADSVLAVLKAEGLLQ